MFDIPNSHSLVFFVKEIFCSNFLLFFSASGQDIVVSTLLWLLIFQWKQWKMSLLDYSYYYERNMKFAPRWAASLPRIYMCPEQEQAAFNNGWMNCLTMDQRDP